MKVSEIVRVLTAKVLCGQDRLDEEITAAFASDMMSDALAFMSDNMLLLTGMVNTHVIRTAEMLDVHCILFVRGKPVPEEVLEMAMEQNMTVLSTDKILYVCCGMLYERGLKGCVRT